MKRFTTYLAVMVMMAISACATAASGHLCKLDSFSVGMEFPDGAFVVRSTPIVAHGIPPVQEGAEQIAARFVETMGISETLARQRATALLKALDVFRSDPSILRVDLSATAGGDGRIYWMQHYCADDVTPHKPTPRTVGYVIRRDSSRTIWAKNALNSD